MEAGAVARLLEIEVEGSDDQLDGLIDLVVDAVTSTPGILRTLVADRAGAARRHVAFLTLWRDAAAMQEAVRVGAAPTFQVPLAPYLRNAVVSTFAATSAGTGLPDEALTTLTIRRGPDRPAPAAAEAGGAPALIGVIDGEAIVISGLTARQDQHAGGLLGRLQSLVGGASPEGDSYRVLRDVMPPTGA